MPEKFCVSRMSGGWSGPTGLGTAQSPYSGPLAVRNAMGTGILPGDRITFMGEYGPILKNEIVADFPYSGPAVNAALTMQQNANTQQGGIVWGDRRDSASNCRNMTFVFRGPSEWHIDARGASGNSERMRAALLIQGTNNVVEDLRIAAPDWNYIAAGRVPSTGANYAPEVSWENFGLQLWGGWGGQIRRCTGWGSNAFGRTALSIEMGTNEANQANTKTIIEDSAAYGSFYGVGIRRNALIDIGAATVAADYMPAAGADAIVRNNRLGTCRWGDTLAIPAINNAMYHGGMIDFQGFLWLRGWGAVYGNELYGDCQDALQAISGNVDVFDNYIHDVNPLYPGAETFLRWYDNAGAWATVAGGALGGCIKLGLTGYDGNVSATVWPDRGTLGGLYFMPALRNRAFRNRIENINGTGPAISSNGSSGMIIVANEIRNAKGIAVGGSDASAVRAHWVANNYVKCKVYDNPSAINVGAVAGVWLYNNILERGGAGVDITTPYGTSTVHGGNNRLVTNTSFFGASVNNMRGNTSGAADYVWGVGPTAGGNCANAGSWEGVIGARCEAALRDLLGNRWVRTVAVGPRQVA